ncbi:MAG TPA: CHAT domain-containing protein [Thermoanaerobaculia bacterium]|nr:CHAT domain-containing protein [Thermoanaerobaculia bacterium]
MPTRLIVQENAGSVQVLLDREGQIIPEAFGSANLFESPLTAEECEDLRWYLENYLETPFAVYQDRGAAISEKIPVWGERLFSAIFGTGKPGRDAYLNARAADPCELWIASSSPAFLGLPWELLKDPDRPSPLAVELAGINRTLTAAMSAADLQPGERLRVLLVIARPYGRGDVRYRTIARPLLERLQPVAGEVSLDVLRPPTFADLKRKLAEARDEGEPYQILHFDGHGDFGKRPLGGGGGSLRYEPASQGYLVFETEAGDDDPVSAEQIATLLAQARVPLLVFNACKSGRVEEGTGPESAVATRLLQDGAAAVVAMGYTVYAVAAAEFMAAFYEALFAGKTVSLAVAEGRRQLHKADLRPSPKGPLPLDDWLVPVCYARRELAFPQLRPTPARPPNLSLAEALAGMRKAGSIQEGVHEEGDLSPEGGRFFGRDAEFQELEKALRLKHVVVLHGVGGTGKTELAKGFARWLRDSGGLDRSDLVFFHSFEPGVASFGLDGVVASVGLRLFGSDFARLGPQERRHAVLEALRRYRMLLVWDNFETVHSQPDPDRLTPPLDEAQQRAVREFLGEVVETARGGVIVTSRSAEDWLGESIHRLEVRGLDALDANELAEALLAPLPRARERRSDAAYAELLEILRGHPLSLRLILPQLDRVANARELVEALRGERDLPAGFEGGEGRLSSLGACVHYSFRHLPEEDQDHLPALTLFEGVADVVVLAVLSEVDGAPERFRGIEMERWQRLLERCSGLGLLTPLFGAGAYRIHPALPAYLAALWRLRAGAAFPEEQEAARLASIHAHAELGDWLDQQIRGGDAATAMSVLTAERRTLGLAAAEALKRGLFGDAHSILGPLNELWNARGLGEEARAWVDRCRELLEDRQGRPPGLETPAGALWLFMVGSQANRFYTMGALDEAEAEYEASRQSLEKMGGEAAQRNLAAAYHQLGVVSQDRGDLSGAETWYRKSLEITESLENRPGMAMTYAQLALLAKARKSSAEALDWTVRCVALFSDFPHPSTGPGPRNLARLTATLGMGALEESWRRCTGEPLPAAVRAWVEAQGGGE